MTGSVVQSPKHDRADRVAVNTAGHPVASADGSLTTMHADGSRKWLYPKPSFGRLWRYRAIVAWGLIAIFVALPFLTINGRPALLLDLTTRRFDIFGHRFLPTDTVLLALLGLSVGLTLFLVTALFGRVWCGWACPQTVYMEFVYRPLERLLQGLPGRSAKNFMQRTGMGAAIKWPIFIVVSFLLANIFLSYFVGVANLKLWMIQSPTEHIGPFILVMVVTALMLANFGFFREQTCLVVCPYGRFQSVMLDRQTTVVAYDRSRGEPRGKAKRKPSTIVSTPVAMTISAPAHDHADTHDECKCVGCDGSGGCKDGKKAQAAVEPQVGDCVDCGQCVTTCPTGIDIRNGLQMECINCTQCIDACDAVMLKLGREPGLVGYRSQAEAEGEPRRRMRARVFLYPALLTIVVTAFIVVLAMQAPSYIRVLRGLGRPYTLIEEGTVANPIKLHIINRHDKAVTYTVEAIDKHSRVRVEGEMVSVEPGATLIVPAMLIAGADAFEHGHYDARLRIGDSAGYSREIGFEMLGPVSHERRGRQENKEHNEHKEKDQ